MLKNSRYKLNVGLFLGYSGQISKALEPRTLTQAELGRATILCEKALDCGRQALKLGQALGKPDQDLEKAVTKLQEIYNQITGKKIVDDSEGTLEKAIATECLFVARQFGVVATNPNDVLASRIVDMYRIAADRFDGSKEVLKMIYVNSPAVPPLLKATMTEYVEGRATKEETVQRLHEIQELVKTYLQKRGLNPDTKEQAKLVILKTPEDLEGKANKN